MRLNFDKIRTYNKLWLECYNLAAQLNDPDIWNEYFNCHTIEDMEQFLHKYNKIYK